jgi:hypothetical protein
MLLEIGLWTSANQLDNGYLFKKLASDPTGVKDKFLKHADLRVGLFARDEYDEAVMGCLNGAIENVPIQEAFQRVVQKLKSVASSL